MTNSTSRFTLLRVWFDFLFVVKFRLLTAPCTTSILFLVNLANILMLQVRIYFQTILHTNSVTASPSFPQYVSSLTTARDCLTPET